MRKRSLFPLGFCAPLLSELTRKLTATIVIHVVQKKITMQKCYKMSTLKTNSYTR